MKPTIPITTPTTDVEIDEIDVIIDVKLTADAICVMRSVPSAKAGDAEAINTAAGAATTAERRRGNEPLERLDG